MDTHPGFATDLLFDRYQGEVSTHPQFWAVRTPAAPDYYFGNYLLLSAAPSDRDKGWLEQSFDKLIATDPRVRHRTFQWPLAEGQNSRVAGFVATGYQYMECVVLTLEREQLLIPPTARAPISVPSRRRTGPTGSPWSWRSASQTIRPGVTSPTWRVANGSIRP